MSENPRSQNVYRAIDANLNRAAEGLRVVEDVFRFQLNDQWVSAQLKELRHLLADASKRLDRQKLIHSRDGQQDAGRSTTHDHEMVRHSHQGLIAANLNRAAQALRSIEEYTKTIDADLSQPFEKLRYRVYDLQKVCETLASSESMLHEIRLCILIDCRSERSAFREQVHKLVNLDHPVMIQLRDKNADDQRLLDRAAILDEETKETKSIWIMNDRPDLAQVANADGVHVGQDDLTVSQSRNIIEPGKLVGLSTHNLEQVEAAIQVGADYVGIGPMFASRTKSFDQFPGMEFAQAVSSSFAIPAFAIGGVNPGNIGQLVEAGVRRVAVSHAIVSANDPSQVAMRLLECLFR